MKKLKHEIAKYSKELTALISFLIKFLISFYANIFIIRLIFKVIMFILSSLLGLHSLLLSVFIAYIVSLGYYFYFKPVILDRLILQGSIFIASYIRKFFSFIYNLLNPTIINVHSFTVETVYPLNRNYLLTF